MYKWQNKRWLCDSCGKNIGRLQRIDLHFIKEKNDENRNKKWEKKEFCSWKCVLSWLDDSLEKIKYGDLYFLKDE
jgi:hypothetical protein